MSKLRKSAKGEQCLVRIPNVCNWDTSTVVLAHLNGGGLGMKHHDVFGSFCCSSCHDVLDGRVPSKYTKDELKLMHYEGMQRTIEIWLRENLLWIA